MEQKRELNWAVLGTGVIANEMAQALAEQGRIIYAVGNRTYEKAVSFAEKYHIQKVYEDFHHVFTDESVDIVYITTPHNTHIDFIIEALKHGKHVLAEKSITLNSSELEEAVKLAQEKKLILAEAQTIYHMPVYKEMRKRVAAGEFGPVNLIQANFGSYKEYDMNNRFFNKALAGGALLDIGVYALSLARSFMNSKPDDVVSRVRFAESGADETSGIVLVNPDGQMAVLSLSLHSKQPKRAVISCDKAYIEIMEYPRAEEVTIVYTETGKRETVRIGETKKALWYEMEDMEQAVRGETSLMSLSLTRDVMEIMTSLRKDWGMYYESEQFGSI